MKRWDCIRFIYLFVLLIFLSKPVYSLNITTVSNSVCNGVSVPTSLFEVKFGKGYVYDVFRVPAFPKQGELQTITAHCNPYKTKTGVMLTDEEWKDEYYIGLVNKGKLGELDRSDAHQAYVYSCLSNSSDIINSGVVIDEICLVATALFDENGNVVEFLGQYGVMWGLAKHGFLYVDYTGYGTFFFIDEGIEVNSVLRYYPDYILVTSIDVIQNFFEPEEVAYSTCNGKARVELPDDSIYYTFKWNDDLRQTTCTALNLCAGEYSVTVTDTRTNVSVVLEVSIQTEIISQENASICEGDIYDFNGQALSEAGTYTSSYTTEEGCEGVKELMLEVNPKSYTEETHSILSGEKYFFNNQWLTEAGTYTEYGTTAAGCESVVVLNLQVIVEETPDVDEEEPGVEGDVPEIDVEEPEIELPDIEEGEEEETPEEGEIPEVEEPEVDDEIVEGDEETEGMHPALMFTPNGDGNNDVWTIKGVGESTDVYIYDRFDKLLAVYKGDFKNWDGIYNGHLMPADDYWYIIVDNAINKRYVGHFTLKR